MSEYFATTNKVFKQVDVAEVVNRVKFVRQTSMKDFGDDGMM